MTPALGPRAWNIDNHYASDAPNPRTSIITGGPGIRHSRVLKPPRHRRCTLRIENELSEILMHRLHQKWRGVFHCNLCVTNELNAFLMHRLHQKGCGSQLCSLCIENEQNAFLMHWLQRSEPDRLEPCTLASENEGTNFAK